MYININITTVHVLCKTSKKYIVFHTRRQHSPSPSKHFYPENEAITRFGVKYKS